MTWQAIIQEPSQKANACVIWLHGLGADGYDFEGITQELGLPLAHGVRFILPHAPTLPVTLNFGYVMPAWYDIIAIDMNAKEHEEGIRISQAILNDLIQDNINDGIPANRIILMGFSQGGALALHTALRYEKPLAGIGCLSGYLPLHRLLEKEKNPANQHIPIFMAHGLMDDIVPLKMANLSLTLLQEAGYQPAWHTYPMAHGVCHEELQDIGKWIMGILF
ncbi:MAG: alpha/beta hydrolase [Candidatus Berkiella sp.]